MSDIASMKPSLNGWSADFLDSQYQAWKRDPKAVDSDWQAFFAGFELGMERDVAAGAAYDPKAIEEVDKLHRVTDLVEQYRTVGHLAADIDPLGSKRPRPASLDYKAYGLSEEDLGKSYANSVFGTPDRCKLGELVDHLEATYCGKLGADYMHILNLEERRWIQQRLEGVRSQPKFTAEERKQILRDLIKAEEFEDFIHENYKGEKRFSLEGAETFIAMLKGAIDWSASMNIEEVVLGMAHRGRLNVLANLLNKPYDVIFAEFQQNYEESKDGAGDVKYHKGYSVTVSTTGGRSMNLRLVANPSHLEAVNPVVMGRARAKQRTIGDTMRNRVLPILIHGDAAISGQGIVMECLQMASLKGYTVGGTLHIVINNQVGFTTNPRDSRSSAYCTDIARMIEAPVFHVNGDDPDLCLFIARLAIEYRETFGKDVFIDMVCYRKYGHNEGDEPAYTQPRMYEIIRKRPSVRSLYELRLRADGVANETELESMGHQVESLLSDANAQSRELRVKRNQEAFKQKWGGFKKGFSFNPAKTGVPVDKLKSLGAVMGAIPDSFEPHPKLRKLIVDARRDAIANDKPLDWGTVENLAYASLVSEGVHVRLTGQDARRGTFAHRHAVLVDHRTEEYYCPINAAASGNGFFEVYDSLLSEASVMGFEYGYSLEDPTNLVLWEAQFGDFANGAQVVIDQFLASAETKWDRSSGLVLLLPHGYEGQGPEHSSARLERFLQLCAEDNMQVCNITTPANLFHALRRQVKVDFRKPLVVMSPKSLLRHEKAVSTLAELAEGHFQPILDDAEADAKSVKRVYFCSGKVYYDLAKRRAAAENGDTAIVRLEMIYPLHTERVKEILARYPKAQDFYWVQEEPRNMGAWLHIAEAFRQALSIDLGYIGRPASATPAAGFKKTHDAETAEIMDAAFPMRKVAAKA